MADRIFAGVLLMVTLAYAIIAFTAISAPFQYDPLGPESWPRILSVATLLCLCIILWRPGIPSLGVIKRTWIKLAACLVLLLAYSALYEPLGFIVSTFLYAAATCVMLGGGWVRAALFGVAAGVLGYAVGAVLLELNLPSPAILEALWDRLAGPDTAIATSTLPAGSGGAR